MFLTNQNAEIVACKLLLAVTVNVVRDRKTRTALRTNQIPGLFTVPSWEK